MFRGPLWRRAQKDEGASSLHFLPFCGIFYLAGEHRLLLIVAITMTMSLLEEEGWIASTGLSGLLYPVVYLSDRVGGRQSITYSLSKGME